MLGSRKPVAIEIGSHTVKVAQLLDGRGRVRRIRFADEPLPAGYRWEIGADRAPLVAAIRRALARAGIRTRSAIISLPRRQVTARISSFPPADRAELQRVVEYDLADHIPFPVDQVVVDMQPLGRSREEPGLIDVLVVAAQRDLVHEYLGLAEDLRLRLTALTVDALALDDLTRLSDPGGSGLTITVALGARATIINVAYDGRLRLTRSVSLGAHQLARAIQDDFGVTSEEAEQRMQAGGLRLLERKPVPSRVRAWLDNLLGEIRRSALSFGPAVVARIMLASGGAPLPGLAEAIEAESGVEPIRLSPTDLFPDAVLRTDDPQSADRCLLAMGQALRALGSSAWTISLVPAEVLRRRRVARLRRVGVLAAVLVVAGAIGAYLAASRSIADLETRVASLAERAEAADVRRAEAEELTAERDRLRAQLDAVELARVRRYVSLELLRTIGLYAPEEIALSQFLLQPDQSLEIRGTAPTSAAAADLQGALSSSPLITDVSLVSVDLASTVRAQSAARGQPGPAEGQGKVQFTMRIGLWTRREAPSPAALLARKGGAR